MEFFTPLYSFLKDSGNNVNAVGDYSGSPESFAFAPAAGELVVLKRMLVFIEDGGAFDTGAYGNGSALSNGITVNVKNGAGLLYTLTPEAVKTNANWAGYCYDFQVQTYGAGNEYAAAVWDFSEDEGGGGLALRGDSGEFLEVLLNDDFSGLVNHKFRVRGRYFVK
jgi:hypothetical protein